MKFYKYLNNKGFTLVEVLGVIVILAALSLIVVSAVTKYMDDGKKDYNQNLKNQLEVSAKSFFSDNKGKLPIMDYSGSFRNGVSYGIVTMKELETNNYINSDFKDYNEKSCSSSYVVVKYGDSYGEYNWHPCLKCENINYSNDDIFCKITNWNDKLAPVCDKNNETYVNPSSVMISGVRDDSNTLNDGLGKIISIEIRNNDTNKLYYVTDTENIESINVVEELKNMEKSSDDLKGFYQVSLIDGSGNSSNICSKFSISW